MALREPVISLSTFYTPFVVVSYIPLLARGLLPFCAQLAHRIRLQIVIVSPVLGLVCS